jgi:DNA-directed RNA polymerase specialized sigma24 family protein
MQKEKRVNAWLDHLSDQLRDGLDEVREELESGEWEAVSRLEPALAGLRLDDLLNPARKWTQRELDPILYGIVRCFRQREKRLWAPVLLRVLAPALINRAFGFVLKSPERDPVEILEQMVLEVLVAADRIPLSPSNRWVQARIVKRAGNDVRRWLEAGVQQRKSEFEDPDGLRRLARVIEKEEARWEICDLLMSGPRSDDLDLIHNVAMGEVLEETADRLGISLEGAKTRIRRARQRLQRLLRAELGCPEQEALGARNLVEGDPNPAPAAHRTVYGPQHDLPEAA